MQTSQMEKAMHFEVFIAICMLIIKLESKRWDEMSEKRTKMISALNQY